MIKYQFRNKTTKTITGSLDMTISEMESYLVKHKNIEVVIGTPGFHSGLGMKKPDSGFRDVLKRIKRQNRRSNINTF